MGVPRIALTLAAGLTVAIAVAGCQSESREAAGVDSPGQSTPPASSVPSTVISETPDTTPALSPREPDQANDTEIAEITLLASRVHLADHAYMRGQTFPKSGTTLVLSMLMGCDFGCTKTTFNFPNATGPLAQLSGTPGIPGSLTAQMTVEGEFPLGEPTDVYPGQVYFTAASHGSAVVYIQENGFTPLPFGDLIGEGILAFQTPQSHATPVNPLLGELRLFAPGSTIPTGFIPADGRKVESSTRLGYLLSDAKYPVAGGKVAVPLMEPISSFTWAIATEGLWPEPE